MFQILQENRKYLLCDESKAFPGLKSAELLTVLAQRATLDETAFIRHFRAWVRQKFQLSPA